MAPRSLCARVGRLIAAFSLMLCATSIARAQDEATTPIQHYIMIDVRPTTDLLVLDRWYLKFHAPETLARTQRAQTRYVSYRTYAVSDAEATRYAYSRGRMTEIEFSSLESFRAGMSPEARARVTLTLPPAGLLGAFESVTVTMPQVPYWHFKGDAAPAPNANPYVRWIVFLAHPEGVSPSAFDAWIGGDLAGAISRTDTIRFAIGFRAANTPTESTNRMTGAARPRFSRVLEVWFDDMAGWRTGAAALEAILPRPSWGGSFPFAPFRTTLIAENPDLDFKAAAQAIP